MTKNSTTKTERAFRSGVTAMLCEHAGRCDGPSRPQGRLTAGWVFVPCLGLAVRSDSSRTDHKKVDRDAETVAGAGWAIIRVRERPLAASDIWDVEVRKGASAADLVAAVGRQVARMSNAGALTCSTALLRRVHDVIRPDTKPWRTFEVAPKSPKLPAWVSALGDKGVVLVDCDGTIFDAMACHGYWGNFESSDGCTHVRHDTLAIIREICENEDAVPVVLSWRGGMYKLTKDWCKEIGLGEVAVLVPGSPELPSTRKRTDSWGQMGFKAEVAEALIEAGVRIVASFDDSVSVCDAMRKLGVPYVHQVPHLVEVEEWNSARNVAKTKTTTRGSQPTLWPAAEEFRSRGYGRGSGAKKANWSWDDDMLADDEYWETRQGEHVPPRDATEFNDLLECGEAEYGRDYTVDGDGQIIPLYDFSPEGEAMHVVDGSTDDDLCDEAAAFLREHAGR